MKNLLQQVRFSSAVLKKKGAVPLAMEFQVEPELAPFLVTTSTGFRWFEEPIHANVVRAAVYPTTDLNGFFMGVVKAVADKGRELEWGNVFPPTDEGIRQATEYVRSYDLSDLEIMIPNNTNRERIRALQGEHALPLIPSSWLPPNCYLVVPRDRMFLGFFGRPRPRSILSVVHNPSRGLGIAWDPAK